MVTHRPTPDHQQNGDLKMARKNVSDISEVMQQKDRRFSFTAIVCKDQEEGAANMYAELMAACGVCCLVFPESKIESLKSWHASAMKSDVHVICQTWAG
jgi:hypothetical protein